MSGLKASKEQPKSNFKRPDPLDPGSYPARLVRIYDLGLQPQRDYQGQSKPPAHMISATYELSDEFLKDDDGNDLTDKPRWVSHEFVLRPLTSELANSTKAYKALDPDLEEDGDWVKMLGRPVVVNIVQGKSKKDPTKVYENIHSLSVMRKKESDKLPPLVNDAKFFDLNDPDMEVYNSLPKWLQEKIAGNLEFAGSLLEKALAGSPAEKAPKKEAPKKETPPPADDDQDDDTPW